MNPHSPVPRAPRWLWVVTVVVAVLVAAFASFGVVELLDSDRDEPEGLADLAGLVVLVVSLPALGLLLVAVGLRRRSGHVVVPLLVTSLASGGLLLVPVVVTLPTTLLDRDPVPPYDEAVAARSVVVYSHDPVSSVALEPRRLTFGGELSEQARVDAAVNELIGSPAPSGRRTYWSMPCTRTYTGVVSLDGEGVRVDLLGPPRSGSSRCRLTPEEEMVREQQLAWTVRSNLDDPATVIRVREQDTEDWAELVADPAYVEHR